MTPPACCAWRTRWSISNLAIVRGAAKYLNVWTTGPNSETLLALRSALRLIFWLLIEPLKRFAYDLAAPVADGVKHVSDLQVQQALHHCREQQRAEQNQSRDHDAGDQRHGSGPIAIDMKQRAKGICERGNENTQGMKQFRVASQKENDPRRVCDGAELHHDQADGKHDAGEPDHAGSDSRKECLSRGNGNSGIVCKVCLFKSWQRNPGEETCCSVDHGNQPERHRLSFSVCLQLARFAPTPIASMPRDRKRFGTPGCRL